MPLLSSGFLAIVITVCSWIRGLKQGSSNHGSWATSSLLLVLVKNSFIESQPHQFLYVSSRVPFTLQGLPKLNGCDRDSLAWRGEYVYYIVFYRHLLTPSLYCASGGTRTTIASVSRVGQRKVSGCWKVEGAELSREDYLENSRHI